MEQVADGRLDRLPQSSGTFVAHVSRRDRDLRAAGREFTQRVAASRQDQSTSNCELLLDDLEP